MNRCWCSLVVAGCWVGLACLLSGCGPKEVRGATLKGQLLTNGQPLKAQPGERVWVTFERADSGGGRQVIMTTGQMQKDGTFALEGQVGKGTPPGQYSVTIHGEFSGGEGENRFANLFPKGNSPFVAEVTDQEGQTFIIDIGKKTITRQ